MDCKHSQQDRDQEQSEFNNDFVLSDDGIDLKSSNTYNEIETNMECKDDTSFADDGTSVNEEADTLHQTMIIHEDAPASGQASGSDNKSGCDPAAKRSKELASDEVISDCNLRKIPLSANINKPLEDSCKSIKPEMESLPVVKPKTVMKKNNQPVYIEKYASYDIYSPKVPKNYYTSDVRKCKVKDEKNIKLEDPLDIEGDFEVINSDEVGMEYVDSFSILDNLEEYGAVGGKHIVNKASCSKQKDGSKSKDNLSGILHRKSSVNRKSSSVQFDDSVAVETFSQVEPTSDCSQKVILAQGDGPDPTQAPANMFGPFQPTLSMARLNDIPDATTVDNTAIDRIVADAHATVDETPQPNPFDTLPNKGVILVHRKGSAPRVMSPTEMLRKKQKKVTDKIIHSIKSSNSKKVPSNQKQETQPESKALSCENNVECHQNIHQTDRENCENYSSFDRLSEKDVGLVRVNSSDFIDPKHLSKFPNSHGNSAKAFKQQLTDFSSDDDYINEVSYDKNIDCNGVDSDQTQSQCVTSCSPSDFLQKIDDQNSTETLGQQSGSFCYTTPSKLLQKIEDREKTDASNQGLGLFDYTSPSELLHKIDLRDREECSDGQEVQQAKNGERTHQGQQVTRTDNNELSAEVSCFETISGFHSDENVKNQSNTFHKKIKKNEPGYWFFKSTDSSFSGSFDTSQGEERYTHSSNLDGTNETCNQHNDSNMKANSNNKKLKDKQIQERCRKKKRLDELRQLTLEHSRSNLQVLYNSSTELSKGENVDNICLNGADGTIQAHGSGEVVEEERISAENDKVHNEEVQRALDYMNSLLIDYLIMIKLKREKDIPINVDDYRELELIQTTILSIGNRLTPLTESPTASSTSCDSPSGSIQEGGSSQVHIDSHDRGVINRHLHRLRMSLSNTEKNIQSWSNTAVNRAYSEGNRKNKEGLYGSKSAGERTWFSESQQQQKEKAKAYVNENEHHRSLDGIDNICDSLCCSKCISHTCSGYLGDRSESENSIPDAYTRKQMNIGGGADVYTEMYGIQNPQITDDNIPENIHETDVQMNNQESCQDIIHHRTRNCETDSLLEMSQSVSLGDYMSVSSLSPSRENNWSPDTDSRTAYQTGVSASPTYSDKQTYPEFQWSRIAHGKAVNADCIYPGYYLADNPCTTHSRGVSTEPQGRSQNKRAPSNVRLTSNPYFKPQSSSEFENDDGDDDYDDVYEAHENGQKVIISPRKIELLTCVSLPDDLQGVHLDLGPTSLTVTRQDEQNHLPSDVYGQETNTEHMLQEGSPERGQKLYGSSQNLDRRGDVGVTKRKQAGARSLTPDSRSFMMEREVNDSQNRKLQMENSTLQTENKLLKEKNNRSQARISELESQLAEAQEDLNVLQDNLNQEVSDLSIRTKNEIERGRDELQTKMLVLSKENEALKAEVSSLEKRLEGAQRATDMARHNSEKARTIDAYKLELATMKEELNRVKALLDQSEKHLREEEERHTETTKQVLKLTELKNALQQQSDTGGNGAIVDKQMKSLEKRLKVTEERLHHERSDRANNLSSVEDKLLTDNSRLQASEKDLKRQLQREKEKNRNLDHRVKQLREDNEKLRIALPFDESVLVADSHKYDIPYGSHSSQRAETMKNLSDDMNYILSQIEKQDGLSAGQEDQIICTLWNKRELAYKHLREYELQIEELQIHDNNNIVDGLKNLRDTYSQSEGKLRNMEEQMEDMQSQMLTTDATYKEQLSELVKERHDAFAKLKTAEDLLEAVRAENESLRKNVSLTHTGVVSGQGQLATGESFEALKQEIVSLEGKLAQQRRTNEKLEGELTTAKVQLDARNKALQDMNSELDLAYNRLQGEEVDDRKQIKIDKLTSQVNSYQIELKSWTDRYNIMVTEKSKLETELSLLKKSMSPPKGRQQKMEQIESKVLQKMKDDLIDKEGRLTSVTKQLEDMDHELQKVRQELYGEQMHTSEMEDELDTLQHTATQRAQMFEALSGTEREQLAQYQILKETLDTVNQELAQKQAQIISLDVNLSGQRDRTVELEHEVERLRRERQDTDEIYTEDEQKSAHQLRISVLEQERAQLKQELTQAYSAIQAAEEQYRTLQTETSQIEQELVKEKTIILQITAEKGEIEQHLEELAEEHDALIQEKNQVEEDLIKLETKLQEILQKYEAEAKKQHSDFSKQYPTLPPEGRKLVSELDSLRLVVEGKNREIEMLKDKLSRCNMEIDFLNRKVELVHNDSISNREDVARMISELTLKMKEAVSTREVNQYLVEERTKLQNEKTHLESELEQERKINDDRKREITDVIRKIERSETHKKSVEKDSKDKEGTIATLEVELRSSQHSLTEIESENTQLKTKLDHLNHDLKNLTTINESLEKHLEVKKGTLSEEKSSLSKLQEDHSTLSRDYQVLQHDHKVMCDKYEAEMRNVDNLHRDLEVVRKENSDVKEELQTVKIDLDTQKGQLVITKESVQKLTQDKGSIHHDYESMCRTLTEKERQLNELKERSEEKLELVKREHAQETRRLEEHKTSAVQECEEAKKEMDSLNEQLKQKEIQLNTFGKTLQELEAVSREKKVIESQFQRLETSSGDSKLLLEGQRKEIMALNESLAKLQERTIRVESENHGLETELKSEKDNSNREIHELKLTIKELKSQHENERQYLNDNLAQTQNRLRSVETSLASASKERDQLEGHQRIKERAVEELQTQFSDESTGRRLAEQSVGTLRLQLEDAKNAKNVAEARFTEMQSQLNKAETQHKTEQQQNQRLLGKVQELQAVSHTTETSVKAKSEQLDTLQKEILKLKQLIDSQKQSHLGKMKKSALEFKQQLDLAQEEKDKLLVQVQQVAADLDACREHVASKNKENLKLQEEALMLEDSLRESKTKQKYAEETLKIELDKQSQLSSRFRDQDEELKRLRNFLAKKVEESGDADKSMWHEMNRVIQELSKQMANHLDAQKTGGTAKEGEGQSVVRFKKQITELQSELNTEKSLHQITKTSLQALEEDCQRLRHQLQSWRRRDPHSSDKKYKNRMEAINAIIAKSQSQAQALLASGGYLGNSMYSPRTQPNRPGYGSPQHNDSPDNSYSEDLSIASLPPLHYGSPTKYP